MKNNLLQRLSIEEVVKISEANILMEESPAKEDARPHILNNFQQDKTISQCVEWISANNKRDRKVLNERFND